MWIRSQNKDALINAESISIDPVDDSGKPLQIETCIVAYGHNPRCYCSVGFYSKEQAFEILDDIQELLVKKNGSVYQMPERKESGE